MIEMEKLNLWDHGLESWVGFFVLESLSRCEKGNNPMLHKGYDPSSMEVKLIVNGVELPLVETFQYIGSKFEEKVKEKAEEITQERIDTEFMNSLRNISRLTNELEEEIQNKITNMIGR